MPSRLRFTNLVVQRRLISGRQFSASHVSSSSRTEPTTRRSVSKERNESDHVSSSLESRDHSMGPIIPDPPDPKHFPISTKRITRKRPAVTPSPTLVLPPSMHPSPPRPPLPISPNKQTRSIDEGSNPPVKAYDIYMKSLDSIDTEPTLSDLDALRPSLSTLRAAWDGVIGSGRSLLPDGHALHLAIEQLGAPEASVGGGPRAKKKVVAGSPKAKKMEYTALYEATEGLVARGFNLPQLRRLERESRRQLPPNKQELPPEKSSSKAKIIHRIMHSRWKMMHPQVIKDMLVAENEIKEQVYPVSPSELFIFLGKDGENLLQLAKELHMNIAVDRELSQVTDEPKPPSSPTDAKVRPGFIIRASGVRGGHKKLKKHLEDQRSLMAIKIVALPAGPLLSPTVLHSVSRISGAFVENIPAELADLKEAENSVLITARNSRSAYTAERLVQRAAMEIVHRSRRSLFCLTSTDESLPNILDPVPLETFDNDARYAPYPFNAEGFRIRRVQYGAELHQYNSVSAEEELILTGKMPRSDKENITVTNLKGEVVDLKRHIFGEGRELPVNGITKIVATYGHIAFKNPTPSTLGLPLSEAFSRNSILEWVGTQKADSRQFIPGQVPTIVPSNLNQMASLHRLQYRTIDGDDILNVDVQLPDDVDQPVTAQASPEEVVGSTSSTDRLQLTGDGRLESTDELAEYGAVERVHAFSISGKVTESETPQQRFDVASTPLEAKQGISPTKPAEPVETAGEPGREPTLLPTEIVVGTEIALELMLPDGTMDVYLQLSNTAPLQVSNVPESLETYLKDLSIFFTTDTDAPQPDPPQQLSIEGKDYLLTKNTSSRYAQDLNVTNLPPSCIMATEMSLDLENNSKAMFTQLAYDANGGGDSWDSFLHACYRMAQKSYERSGELRANPT